MQTEEAEEFPGPDRGESLRGNNWLIGGSEEPQPESPPIPKSGRKATEPAALRVHAGLETAVSLGPSGDQRQGLFPIACSVHNPGRRERAGKSLCYPGGMGPQRQIDPIAGPMSGSGMSKRQFWPVNLEGEVCWKFLEKFFFVFNSEQWEASLSCPLNEQAAAGTLHCY